MTVLSFHGDPAVKADAIRRLRECIDAGQFRASGRGDGNGMTAVSCIVGDGGPRAYAEQLGYPLPLAGILESATEGCMSDEAAAPFALRWLEETPVGADLSGIAGTAILKLMDDATLVAAVADHALLNEVRGEIVALHRREQAGDAPSREEWKAVRNKAVAATDAATEKMEQKAAAMMEAACWSSTARATLKDTASGLLSLTLTAQLEEMGWTAEEERRAFGMMADYGKRPDIPEEVRQLRGEAFGLIAIGSQDMELFERLKRQSRIISGSRAVFARLGEIVVEELRAAAPARHAEALRA